MKKIQLQYNKNGNHHRQIFRLNDIAIYEMTSPENGRILGYEVFEVQKFRQRQIAGRMIEASEGTPSNEQWGIKGFTIWQKSDAFKKAAMMQAERDKRKLAIRNSLELIKNWN